MSLQVARQPGGLGQEDRKTRLQPFDPGDDKPRLFAVISWGCAGTTWLAKVLNAHRDIFCVHHLRHWLGRFGLAIERCDDAALLRTLQGWGHEYRLAGDVHGVSRHSVPELRQRLGDCIRCAGLVRAPHPRLHSHLALFEAHRFDARHWPGIDYVTSVAGYERIAHHIVSSRQLLFVHAVNMLNAIIEEERLFPIWRLEDLSSRPEALSRLLDYLSAGELDASEEFAERALAIAPANQHSLRVQRRREFESWQLEVIRAILRPEAVGAYHRLGYDVPLDWLPRRIAA